MATYNEELQSLVHLDMSAFTCANVNYCPYKDRTLSYMVRFNTGRLSGGFVDNERVFKECCYIHTVFASTNFTEDFKNDYSSFPFQRQLEAETLEMFLYEYKTGVTHILANDTYGQLFEFGYFESNKNLAGFRVDWRKVLLTLGTGSYRVIMQANLLGNTEEFNSFPFTLREYSAAAADHTVRIDTVMNGEFKKTGLDFRGTSWRASIRVGGFFGRRTPEYVEDSLITVDTNERDQLSIEQTNKLSFQTNFVPDCIFSEIVDFHFLADKIFMNDYNANNSHYGYIKKPYRLLENGEVDYDSLHRKIRINATFTDRFEDNIKQNYD